MSIVKDSSITFFFLLLVLLAEVVWGVITARTLGPAGKGILAVAIFYPTAFFTIGHLSINMMNIHYVGKREYALERFAGNSLFLSLVISALLYALFLATLPFFSDTLYKGVPSQLLYLAFATIPLVLIMHYFRSILQGVQKIFQFNMVNLSSGLAKLLIVVLLVILWRYGVMGALLAAVIGFGFGAFVGLSYTKKMAPGKWKVDRELLKKLVFGGSKLHISSISTFLYGYMEIAMVNYFLSSKQVGYIAVAIAASRMMFLLSQAVSTVLYPEVSKKEMKEAEHVNSVVCRNAFMLIVGATVLAVFLAKQMVLIYAGGAFLPAVLPLQIMLVGTGMSTFAQLMSPLWVRKGWFWQLSVLALIMLAINFLLNIYLIPRYGLVGAAWAKSLTYAAGFIQICIVYFIFVDKRFWHAFIPQRSDFELYKSAWRRYVLKKDEAAIIA